MQKCCTQRLVASHKPSTKPTNACNVNPPKHRHHLPPSSDPLHKIKQLVVPTTGGNLMAQPNNPSSLIRVRHRQEKADLASTAADRKPQDDNTARAPTDEATCRHHYDALTKANDEAAFRFMDLPPELRNLVYRELLVLPNKSLTCHPQILRASQLIHGEATGLLYGENVVQITVHFNEVWIHSTRFRTYYPRTNTRNDDFRHLVGTDFLRQVQHLRIVFGFSPAARIQATPVFPHIAMIGNVICSVARHLAASHRLRSLEIDLTSAVRYRRCRAHSGLVQSMETAFYPLRLLGRIPSLSLNGIDDDVQGPWIKSMGRLTVARNQGSSFFAIAGHFLHLAFTWRSLVLAINSERRIPSVSQPVPSIDGAFLLRVLRYGAVWEKKFVEYVDRVRLAFETAERRGKINQKLLYEVEIVLRKGVQLQLKQTRHWVLGQEEG